MDTTLRKSESSISKGVITTLLLVGPYLTVALVLSKAGTPLLMVDQVSVVLKVALLFWSPVFFSIPALLTQDGRDEALPNLNGLVRSVVLVPWLLLSPKSSVRTETAASLVGLLAGFLAAAPHLAW